MIEPEPRDRPIRLGIFVIAFPTPSETFIVRKALGLLDAGVDVQIFTTIESPHWDRFEELKGRDDVRRRIHVMPPLQSPLKVVTVGSFRLLTRALSAPWEFARYVSHTWRTRHATYFGFWKGLYQRLPFVGQRLDLLHVEFDAYAPLIADLKTYLGCRVVLSARGDFRNLSLAVTHPDTMTRAFRLVDGYHFISEYLRRTTYHLGLPPDVPTWLIEPAVSLEAFRPRGPRRVPAEGEPIRILSVGRLAWAKGWEFAVDAVAKVVKAGVPVQYTLVGEGPYEEAVVFAARQTGLLDAGVIRFAGGVPASRMPEMYQEADILLHSAVEEGFCNAVIEAQAMALPVVTSDANALPENVEDGVTGFVVPRRDSDAMAEALIRLARDPELRARMGRAGRARAQTRFDIKDQIPKFLHMYESLLDAGAPTARTDLQAAGAR